MGFFSNPNSNVKELTDSDFDLKNNSIKSYSKSSPGIVLFYAPWCGHCKNYKNDYITFASYHHGHIQCFAVNSDDKNPETKKISKLNKINSFPTIKYVNTSGKIINTEYKGQRDEKSILDYMCNNVNKEICNLKKQR